MPRWPKALPPFTGTATGWTSVSTVWAPIPPGSESIGNHARAGRGPQGDLMQTTLDAIVNARLPGREGLFHIPVSGGRFGQIAPQAQTGDAARGPHDDAGDLVGPAVVEPHRLLDAAYTAGGPRWQQSGTVYEGIECSAERKPLLSREDVIHRGQQALRLFADNG